MSNPPSVSGRSSNLHLLLASTSPRRAQLLRMIGLPFTVVAAALDEPDPTPDDERYPARYVERLARLKAAAFDMAAATSIRDNGHGSTPAAKFIVLAADTTVWHEGHILNKPRDAADACRMLKMLRGQSHQVFTGVCLRVGDEYSIEHEVTTVHFAPVSDQWITSYVATGEPLDKAGAYGAQERGALLIERIEGDFFNVVGLPLACLSRMLARLGAPIEMWWQDNNNL